MKMKPLVLLICIVVLNVTLALSALAFGGGGHGGHEGGGHRGGGGTPEPLTMALIVAGGAAAYGVSRVRRKK